MLPQIGEMRPWADPTITQINRLPMHTPIKRDKKISLNGSWPFELFSHPDDVQESVLTNLQSQGRVFALQKSNHWINGFDIFVPK